VKALLGFRAKGRDVIVGDDGYQLGRDLPEIGLFLEPKMRIWAPKTPFPE
jgi:hypothetical protein